MSENYFFFIQRYSEPAPYYPEHTVQMQSDSNGEWLDIDDVRHVISELKDELDMALTVHEREEIFHAFEQAIADSSIAENK